ncbi:NAD(P)-dependent alcohol dehydrogenase [Sphingomonas bacterium]|uniref:NAD(P)-dependent alcohol dehydrogenase n=1 Tax=Sphingomonas bacterium TaxID=1895847 RepID=UPI002612C344|nr:NAD(P)-dependent alcohol dehydrogenase [Sphingomonas bacterium]MDB5677346.1 NADPH:quinone reductase and related Zn-dependent oxidoreductase [Sphingomonas bacterium]
MKAAVVTRFGRRWSIEVAEVPKPVPAAGEILVRVRAATVNRSDCGELLHPLFQRLITRQPRRSVLGMDFAGEVEAVGDSVANFRPGDRVFGMTAWAGNGGQAEYVCLPETAPIAAIPANVSFDQAPVFEGAYYASGTVAAFGLKPGHSILIYGASGAIGTAAVQLAKHAGANVTAVVPTQHIGLARLLGADRVIDYTMPEFSQLDDRFDFVLDAVGKMPVRHWQRLLKPNGRFALTDLGSGGRDAPFLLWSAITRSGKVSVPLPPRGSAQNFVHFLGARMEAGEFRAAIDRKYPLDRIADAYRYVLTGQKAGIVVIDVGLD